MSASAPEQRRSRRDELRELHGRALREHAARGTVINSGFMIALTVLGLLRGFVLARFLTRTDYGVWGILIVALTTLVWLKQAGVGDRYIQQDEPDQELAFQKAFTLELLLTGVIMVMLLLALPILAFGYGEWKLIPPGLVIVAMLPAGALQSPLWIFFRKMDFVRQRVLQSAEPVVGFVVTVAMAAVGFGYWALAVGVLAGAWSAALLALRYSPYRLRLRYDRGSLRSYASFSWPLFVATGSSLVMAQASVISVNARLGLAGVGVVTLAFNITAFTQRVDQIVTGTLYPAICAVKDQVTLLHESFVKSNRLALMWAMPFGTGLALFAPDLVHYVLGNRWEPAILLLRIYGLTAGLGHVAFNWDAYMRATGRTKPIATANVASMLTFLIVGVPLVIVDGLTGLAIGVAAQAAANQLCRGIFLKQVFGGFTWSRHALRAILPTVPAAGIVLLGRLLEHGPRTATEAAVELVAYLATTLVATWVFERGLIREASSYLLGHGRPLNA